MCWNMKCCWMFYEQLNFEWERRIIYGHKYKRKYIFTTRESERERALHIIIIWGIRAAQEPISINGSVKNENRKI